MLLDQATLTEIAIVPAMYSPQDIRRRARTKIVATVGPACSEPEQLRALAQAGVDVFRLNMAHGEPDEQQVHVDNIRRVSEELGEPIAILVDLAGPKIRLGELPDDSIFCETDDEFSFVAGSGREHGQRADVDLRAAREGAGGRRPRDAGRRHGDAWPSKRRRPAGRSLRVVQRGTIRSRQGINLPGVKLSVPAISVDRSSARDLGGAGGRRFRRA